VQRISVQTRRLVGGALCLDFTNSVDWDSDGTERPSHTDALRAPGDLAAWGERLGVAAAEVPLTLTGRELSSALALRAATHRVFSAIALGEAPDLDGDESVRREYERAVSAAELVHTGDGWRFDWAADDARRIRFAVVVSAVDLLRDRSRLATVRMCPGNNCGWLFVDATGRRRWCSMEVCGSRAKMRRLYARQQQSRPPRRSA